jgi:hypothetical protein
LSGGKGKGTSTLTAVFSQDFESLPNPQVSGYIAGGAPTIINGQPWVLFNAIVAVPADVNDKKNGTNCIRIKNGGKATFTKPLGGAGTISFVGGAYNADIAGHVEIWTNGSKTGEVDVPQAKTSLSIPLNAAGDNMSFEIRVTVGNRICIDDINITDGAGGPPPAVTEIESNDTFNQATTYIGSDDVTITQTGFIEKDYFTGTGPGHDFFVLPPVVTNSLYVLELQVPANRDYDVELWAAAPGQIFLPTVVMVIIDQQGALQTSAQVGNGVTEIIAFRNSGINPHTQSAWPTGTKFYAKVTSKSSMGPEPYTLKFRRTANGRRFLFDASRRENASTADWQIDADGTESVPAFTAATPSVPTNKNEAMAQRVPTPSQLDVPLVAPGTAFAMNPAGNPGPWAGGISDWALTLVQRGHSVETLPSSAFQKITFGDATNPQDLSKYDVFILPEANRPFTALEKTAIKAFVSAGGGLLMVGDHSCLDAIAGNTIIDPPGDGSIPSDRDVDNWDSPRIYNDLWAGANMGITFDLKTVALGSAGDGGNYQPSSNISNLANADVSYILKGKTSTNLVTGLAFYSGTTMSLSGNAKGLVWGAGAQGVTNVMSAFSTFGSGRVFALGDSSPLEDNTPGLNSGSIHDGWNNDTQGQSVSHRNLHINASLWLAKY